MANQSKPINPDNFPKLNPSMTAQAQALTAEILDIKTARHDAKLEQIQILTERVDLETERMIFEIEKCEFFKVATDKSEMNEMDMDEMNREVERLAGQIEVVKGVQRSLGVVLDRFEQRREKRRLLDEQTVSTESTPLTHLELEQ